MDASTYFKGKKITVMGLGVLGRGVGDTKYLASCGAELIVTDLKTPEFLANSIAELSEFPNITFVLGEHRLEDFHGRDLILKAAGVPADSVFIAEARKQGIPIKMSASLFAELANIPIVGITGTRGKSTVTYMLHAMYETAGKKVLLGGNVRGVSTLALLPEVTSEHIALFELDSWQLQGFGEANISPSIAIFTTFFSDHLNYYHNDLDAYLADKANIFLNQRPEDTLIVGEQCVELIREKYSERMHSKLIVAGLENLPKEWRLSIPGRHNRYNAALALAAARASGISDEISRSALEKFSGVPGRLSLVRKLHGVSFYNDTNSTTPEATIAALRALSEERISKNILLIFGGADKGLGMEGLIEEILRTTKRNILLRGTGTERIRAAFPDAELYDNLAMAFADACSHAEPGDIVLFSPAFASFGLFQNEYDRGDQFTELVNALDS